MRVFYISLLLLVHCLTTVATAHQHSLLLETNWLNTNLDRSKIIIVDTRTFTEYQQAHIKNAINLPANNTFGKGVNNNLLAPVSLIVNAFNKAGIRQSAHIILYDDGRLVDAARLFWVLEVFGLKHVSILNGGIKAWKNQQYPLSQSLKQPIVTNFIPAINPAALATTFSVQFNSNNINHILIDVRSKEEYEGLESKTDQFGHIPGAINIPAPLLTNPITEKLRPSHQLAELYKFLDKNKPVTVYCNKGKNSALSYFSLRQLGFSVNAYNGSWFEWSKNPLLPKEMGRSIKAQNNTETR